MVKLICMVIDLSPMENTVFLIRPCESKVIYTNQAGGYACRHPELEGALIPINRSAELNTVLYDYFDGAYGGWCDNGLTPDDAQEIDEMLRDHHLAVKVDRKPEKLQESMEAWVWVVCDDGVSCILTWGNSD